MCIYMRICFKFGIRGLYIVLKWSGGIESVSVGISLCCVCTGPIASVVLQMVLVYSSLPKSLKSLQGLLTTSFLLPPSLPLSHSPSLPLFIRLGCYDDFNEMIQPPFSSLLPPEPLPVFKYALEEDEFGTRTHTHTHVFILLPCFPPFPSILSDSTTRVFCC